MTDGPGSFIAMDNDLPHEPAWMQYPEYVLQPEITDKGSNRLGSETVFFYYHADAATFRMLGTWFAWMRSNGVYDNTRIVIVSDHGLHFRGDNETLDTDFDKSELAAWNALLLFKDFGATDGIRTDNSFMTVADVPSLAINGTDDKEKKKDGLVVLTGGVDPSDHGKYKFNYSEKYRVKDNIFKAANWEKLK